MSRLIVKNLASSLNEKKLRETFSSLGGQITDVQLKYTPEGKFRHFGFVGFSREEDAQKAQAHFHKNFLNGSKIHVEICADLGDENKPRAWSKYAPDSSASIQRKKSEADEKKEGNTEEDERKIRKAKRAQKKAEKKEQAQALLDKYSQDPKFQEFMRIHKRNATEGVWNNDNMLEVAQSFEAEQKQEEDSTLADEKEAEDEEPTEPLEDEETEAKEASNKALSDLDYLKTKQESDDAQATEEVKAPKAKAEKPKKEPKNEIYFTVKLSGLPLKCKKKDLKAFLKPLKAKSIRRPPHVGGIAYIGFATVEEQKKALIKHKSFIQGHQIMVKKYEKVKENVDVEAKWKEQEDGLKNEETLAESGRLFLRNLSYGIVEEDLETLFKPYGPLAEVNMPIDRITRKPKGFAFITYVIPENATQAYTALDGSSFQGRLLQILPGKSKPSVEELANAEGLTFKQKKALKEKAQASSSHNWNTLFLGTSAVADLMAQKYNMSKSDVLTGDGKQSAAVRLALGETEIVAETRRFLEDEGISLDAFSRPPQERSKTVILIKNLPAGTQPIEIRDKFAKFGELGRVVLPPHGITAIVEYLDPSEARKGFRGLAYSKFHNTPLYLEWAPQNSFTREALPKEERMSSGTAQDDDDSGVDTRNDVDEAFEPEDDTTLFVKNLNFCTTDEELKSFFAKIGPIHSATISKKKDLKRPGEMLSMGYGFVQFKLKSSAERALKNLQHKMLNDHCLELKRSTRATTSNDQVQTTRKQNVNAQDPTKSGTKLMVRNVPFEAHQKEIEDVFKTFGELKSVRLPKKVTGSHRGFCFIEYGTKSDAKKAFEALCHSTHLYGRRLVLEWAENEDTVEDLRRKTASHYVEGAPANKRLKKSEFQESIALETP
ncbi:hypothetical protein TCAL_03592 [Tigriopus californicus]|uniref:RRM domain-containing protein n=3 Tax=Tigriopus californicus TaxID=6832 RepID=A0A553NBC2_TIGCA|nr:hypothetical protein TCAL_03592 [Tigriopus californicus]|eukprot:TCALIF_03592-PA protein Name:"Similar to RBM19 Probable RNA-binding protein 19 (Homo sapiens)" AED:0.25 eAED:0.25 QI:0/-1/0/1/-1/1/1/0/887